MIPENIEDLKALLGVESISQNPKELDWLMKSTQGMVKEGRRPGQTENR